MKRNGGSPPRREVKRSKTTTTVLLPLELIIEILLRLPVKSLVRFKIVCKSWLSLISDPHFTKSHFELSAVPTDRLLLIVDGPREVLSVDFNASLHDASAIAPLSVELPVQKPYIKNVVILGSCRGFLLFTLWHTLCVCNPSTGVHKQVPCSPIASSDEGSTLYLFLRGFGYDPSTDDYLVVQAYCNILILDNDDPAVRVEVFSLRANEWKEIETNLLSYGNTSNPFENEIGLLLNGAVHWLAYLWDESTFHIVILAFDLTERSFLEIPLPVDFMYDQDQLSVLVALGELLSLCACVGSNHSLEIWVMEEYKVQSSWTRTIVVSLDDVPNRCFYPICSTKSGDILGNDGKGGLAKCNDKGQLREHRSYFNGEFGPRAALYRESLLSSPCDSEQAVKDD